jgi:hypothetical protein
MPQIKEEVWPTGKPRRASTFRVDVLSQAGNACLRRAVEIERFTHGCTSSEGWHVQWEAVRRPTEVRVRSLVAWIAGRRETKFLKSIDETIPGRVASHRAVTKVHA